MAKKKYSEEVQNAYDAYGSEVQSAGQDLANGMTAAGQQQIADMEAANKAYNDANNAAIEANRQRSDAAIGSFADMVEGYAQNIRNAEAESAAQVAADQRAARWTGATELASSIANLIAVGGHNAVSQQYKPYSQDWMRKADMDARMNRARIDNLRERQRAMQGQLANMRMNDAARALELARADAKARYDQGLALSQARYNTTVNPLVQAGKTAEEVGKINAQGAAQAANIGLHERQLAQSAAQHAAQLAETKRYHDEQVAIQKAKATKGSGSGKSGLNNYDITVDGKRYTVSMNDTTFKTAVRNGKTDLKKDIAKMAGAESWDDFRRLVSSDKATRDKYYNILSAIEQGGDDNDRVIEDFISENRDELNEFNSHIMRVANSGYGTGTVKPTQPAPSSNTSDDGNLNSDDESQSEQTGMPTAAAKKKDETGLGGYR